MMSAWQQVKELLKICSEFKVGFEPMTFATLDECSNHSTK